MDKEQALRIWDFWFSSSQEAYDYASHPIRREDYQNKESDRGWELDYIKPLSQGGTSSEKNLLPAAFTTILLRGNKTSFTIGKRIYEVRRGHEYKTFAIFDVTERNKPVDLTPSSLTQDPEFNRKRMDESLGKYEPKRPQMDLNTPLRNSLLDCAIQREENAPAVEEKKEEDIKIEETKAPEEEKSFESPTVLEESSPVEEEKEEISPSTPTEETAKEEEPVTEESAAEEVPEEKAIETSLVVESVPTFAEEKEVVVTEEMKEEEKSEELSMNSTEETDKEETPVSERKEEDFELERKLQSLEEEKKKLSERVLVLEEEKKGLEEKNEKLVTEKDSYQRQVQESKKSDLEKENALILSSERERHYQERTERAEKERRELQDKVENLIRENALLSERFLIERKQKEEEYSSLLKEKEELSSKAEKLEGEKEELLRQSASSEKERDEKNRLLMKEKEELDIKNKELQEKSDNLEKELLSLKEEIQKLEQEKSEAEGKRREEEKKTEEEKAQEEERQKELEESARKERERQEAEITSLNEKSMQNEALLVSKDKEIQSLSEEKEKLLAEKEQDKEEKEKALSQKEELEKENNRLKEIQIVLRLAGKEDSYPAIKNELEERGFAYDQENVEAVLARHPEYRQEEKGTILFSPKAVECQEEEIKKPKIEELAQEDVKEKLHQSQEREKAEALFQRQGRGKDSFTDFAGRRIDKDFYQDKESPQGWDIYPLDEKDGLVVNLLTFPEIKKDHPFVANQHLFELVQKDGKWILTSKETVVNPYDLLTAIEICQENSSRKGSLIYLYVKLVGLSSPFADRKELAIFFDLLDRTAKRCCPLSYLQMEVENQKLDQAFVTFDGTIEGAYKEVFDYAILINSYRDAFRKRGKMDAVLVLDELQVAPGQRHDCYERLCVETKDPELNVTRLNLSLSGVVSTPIRRTLHIGREILDKVPIKKEQLRPSRLGQELNKEGEKEKGYMECNFIYPLDGSSQEKGQD